MWSVLTHAYTDIVDLVRRAAEGASGCWCTASAMDPTEPVCGPGFRPSSCLRRQARTQAGLLSFHRVAKTH